MSPHGPDMGAEPVDLTHVDTQDGLARALRQLRRRMARRQNDTPITYRELAARTGWAHGVIGDYFAGKTLPPTNRFDILIVLLGATPAEQGRLATARDRVEELRRSRRTAKARVPDREGRPPAAVEQMASEPARIHFRLTDHPPNMSTVDITSDTEGAFVDIALRVGWATLTMVDSSNRPWSGMVLPLWEYRTDGLTGWVFARSNRIKNVHNRHSRFVSLSYWHPTHGTAVAQCEADWADAHERRRVWQLALRTPPPAGFDPATVWPAGVDSPDCALLRLRPCRLMSASGASQAGGRALLVWTHEGFVADFAEK